MNVENPSEQAAAEVDVLLRLQHCTLSNSLCKVCLKFLLSPVMSYLSWRHNKCNSNGGSTNGLHFAHRQICTARFHIQA